MSEVNKVVMDFIDYFKNLPENEKYGLSKFFNQETGGRLSQHNNPIPVAVAIIVIEDEEGNQKLLGIKRGILPHIGGLAFPGGFQEEGETAKSAAARELLEETGLQTNPNDYEIFGEPLMTKTNNQLMFFKNRKVFSKDVMEQLVLTDEVQGFELIDNNSELCFPLHQQKTKDFFEQTLEYIKKPSLK